MPEPFEFEIPLGRHLSVISLEALLRKRYLESFRERHSVQFDFSKLTSAGLFELAMVLLWARRLRKKSSSVNFMILPSDDSQVAFSSILHRLRFTSIAEGMGITIERHPSMNPSSPSLAPSQKVVVGFHSFETGDALEAFLGFMESNEPELFGESYGLELISGGTLRNILMRELMQNVLDHTKAAVGLTAMRVVHLEGEWSSLPGHPTWERRFLEHLQTPSYLEILVADDGPGIGSTLRGAWEGDPHRSDSHPLEKELPTQELQITQYAFRRFASRKVKPDMFIEEILDQGRRGLRRNVTGLAFARSLVAKNRGLMAVRSAGAWLAWDFSGDPDAKPDCHADDSRTKALAKTGGCQYRILLPLSEQKEARLKTARIVDPRSESLDDYRSGQVLAPALAESQSGWEENEASRKTAGILVRESYARLAPRTYLIADLHGSVENKNQAQALLYLLSSIQMSDRPIVVFAARPADALLREASQAMEREPTDQELPLCLLGRELAIELIGAGEAETEIMSRAIGGETGIVVAPKPAVIERVRHLVTYDDISGRWLFRLSRRRLVEQLRRHLSSRFLKWDEPPPVGIRLTGHFLLPPPSNVYCEHFWDTHLVLEDPGKRDLLVTGLEALVADVQPGLVVVLSRSLETLVSEGLDLLQKAGYGAPELITVGDIEDPTWQFKLIGKDPATRVMLVSGVLGTGSTAVGVARTCRRLNLVAIACVVDARESDSEGLLTPSGEVPVLSIIRAKQVYHRELPPDWSYSSIQTIDRSLHRPSARVSLGEQASLSVKTVEDSLKEYAAIGALDCGHYHSGHRHFSTFISTPRMIEHYAATIVGDMLRAIETVRSVEHGSRVVVTDIVHDESEKGSALLAASLAEAMGAGRIDGVHVDVLRHRNVARSAPHRETRDVVVISQAATTGGTARALLTYAAQFSPRLILLFLIADRMDEIDAWLLANSARVGKSKVETYRFLRLPCRSYAPSDCPQCRLHDEYEAVSPLGGERLIEDYLGHRLSLYEKRPVSTFLESSSQALDARRDLILKEAIAQAHIHQSVSQPQRAHDLAKSLSADHSDDLACCGYVLAVAHEAPLYRSDRGLLSDVAYSTFRSKLLKCAASHVIAEGEVDTEVRESACAVIAEFEVDPYSEFERLDIGSMNLSASSITGLLIEACRLGLAFSERSVQRERALSLVSVLGNRASAGRVETELVALAQRITKLLSSPSKVIVPDDETEALHHVWEEANQILWKHGRLRNALSALESFVAPSRTADELQHCHDDTWRPRVSEQWHGGLVPCLMRLMNSQKEKHHGPVRPLPEVVLFDVTRLITLCGGLLLELIERRNKGALKADDTVGFSDGARRLREDVFGESSAILAFLRGWVVGTTEEINRRIRVSADALSRAEIPYTIDGGELPKDRVLFVAPEDFDTTLETLIENIIKHAFPTSAEVTKSVSIAWDLDASMRFVLDVVDSGIGRRSLEVPKPDVAPSADGPHGIDTVKRLVGSYDDGYAEANMTDSGCAVRVTLWTARR